MTTSPKQKGLLLLQKDRLFIYGSGGNAVYVIPFPPNVVHDLEVLNREELAVRIKVFLEQNKIAPFVYLLILGNTILFDTLLTTTTSDSTSQEMKKFLESVPFEDVLSRMYDVTTKPHVFATNRDLTVTVQRALEKQGAVIAAVIPALFAIDVPQTGELTVAAGTEILRHFDELKRKSMIEDTFYLHSNNYLYQSIGGEKKTAPKNLPMLIGVFVVLIGVLVGLIMFQNTPAQKTIASPPPVVVPEPTLMPTIIDTASASAQPIFTALSVHILYAPPAAAQSDVLRQQLALLGITEIQADQTTVQSANPLILFSPSVPAEVKDNFTNELKKNFPTLSTQESDVTPYDISITLGAP